MQNLHISDNKTFILDRQKFEENLNLSLSVFNSADLLFLFFSFFLHGTFHKF